MKISTMPKRLAASQPATAHPFDPDLTGLSLRDLRLTLQLRGQYTELTDAEIDYWADRELKAQMQRIPGSHWLDAHQPLTAQQTGRLA